MEENEKQKEAVTYELIENAFLEESGSLIPDEVIQKILAEEEKRFLWAGMLDISPERFAGKNVLRYVKGLLRHHQPIPVLYDFLGFMMEYSMLLFLYMILYSAVLVVTLPDVGFLDAKEFLYAAVFLFCILLFTRLKAWRVRRFLGAQSEIGDTGNLSEQDRQMLQKKVRFLPVVPAVFLSILGLAGWYAIYAAGISGRYLLEPAVSFLIYGCFAVLSGIHNVVYSSHIVSFFTIGGDILFRTPKEETETAVTQYKMLSYEKMLRIKGKTMKDFSDDASLAGEMMQRLRGRAVTYRAYSALGFFILLVLDIVCVVQLFRIQVTIPMILFMLVSFLGSVIFLTALLAVNRVIKTLPKKKNV